MGLFSDSDDTAFYSAFGTLLMSGLSVVILLFTVYIYYKILNSSNESLSFAKGQSSYSNYVDNFKLFIDLSKDKTGIILADEHIISNELRPFFENMTFGSIHLPYLKILEYYPDTKGYIGFDLVFKRFNYKVQTFLNTLHIEISRIQIDNNLSVLNRLTLMELYKNYLLFDYINLCQELIQNQEANKDKTIISILDRDYFKCNRKSLVFDTDKFFKLYHLIIETSK
jgi:hypothetical protein